jgi:hypothetical protein
VLTQDYTAANARAGGLELLAIGLLLLLLIAGLIR